MTFLEIIPRVSSQTPLKPPFLSHWPNGLPLLINQRQRTSADSPDVVLTIQIRRLLWFAWNRDPLIDIRW